MTTRGELVRWYAETDPRRLRQGVADALVLAWCLLWALAGRFVHAAVTELSAPAGRLEQAGTDWQRQMDTVAGRVSDLPVIGGGLQEPFSDAAAAGGHLAEAGDQLTASVEALAWWLALATAVPPVLAVLVVHLVLRVRYARRAAAAAAVRDDPGGADLLALRALTRRPPRLLQRVQEDAAGAWRRGDQDAIRRLAALELRTLGLRPPGRAGGG